MINNIHDLDFLYLGMVNLPPRKYLYGKEVSKNLYVLSDFVSSNFLVCAAAYVVSRNVENIVVNNQKILNVADHWSLFFVGNRLLLVGGAKLLNLL